MLRNLIIVLLSAFVLGSDAKAETEAPDFQLRDIYKKEVSLSDYKGKVVLVNFWATWCQPCLVELPHLQEMYSELKEKEFVVLSISVDAPRDVSKVKPLVKTRGLEFPVLLDSSSSVLSVYNPSQALPYNVLIDKEGKVVWTKEAYAPGEEAVIKEKVLELLSVGQSEAAPSPETGNSPAPE
ncbi:MAG: TlpA family protein disulfide reductase [Myxococcota bacterium]